MESTQPTSQPTVIEDYANQPSSSLARESASVTKFKLKYIKPRHQEIARRLVLGQTQQQISEQLGITPAWLSRIVHDPLFKLQYNRLVAQREATMMDVREQLEEIAPDALDTMVKIMYNPKNPTLQFNAAKDILDRAGFGAVQKSQVNVQGTINHHAMNKEELKAMIADRLGRMVKEQQTHSEELAKAEAIEIGYVDESDSDDQTLNDGGLGGYGQL